MIYINLSITHIQTIDNTGWSCIKIRKIKKITIKMSKKEDLNKRGNFKSYGMDTLIYFLNRHNLLGD